MTGRKTVYNYIVTPEKLERANPDNIQLGKDFLEYLSSIDRSPTTIEAYKYDLNIFWVWLLENCNNKFFVNLKKREIAKFQNHCLQQYGWSSARVRRVKSTLSSLSNYIENILDDEYEDYRPIVKKIESPAHSTVRKKTIFTKEQLQTLLDYLVEQNKIEEAVTLSVCMNSGRRKSELPRLKMSYFDDENIIYNALYKTPEQVKTKGRGSKGKMLTLYVLKKDFYPYLEMWREYRKEHNIESDWLLPRRIKGEYVDEPIQVSTLDSWAESFTRFLGVPFYFHSLRHFFTTSCLQANLPSDVVKDLVGWNSLDLVALYDDRSVDEQFEKYFDEDGIKQVEQKSIKDL